MTRTDIDSTHNVAEFSRRSNTLALNMLAMFKKRIAKLLKINRIYGSSSTTYSNKLSSPETSGSNEGPPAIPALQVHVITTHHHTACTSSGSSTPDISGPIFDLQSEPGPLKIYRDDQVSSIAHYRRPVTFIHQASHVGAGTQTISVAELSAPDAFTHVSSRHPRSVNFSSAQSVEAATQTTPQAFPPWHETTTSSHFSHSYLVDCFAADSIASGASRSISSSENSFHLESPRISSQALTSDVNLGYGDDPSAYVNGRHPIITDGSTSLLITTTDINGVHDQRGASISLISLDLLDFNHSTPDIPLPITSDSGFSAHVVLGPLEVLNQYQWDSLARLDIGLVSVTECLSLLQVCTNLIKLTLKLSPLQTHLRERSTVHAKKLTHLTINATEDGDPRVLFDHTNAPYLESVELTGMPHFRDFPDLITRLTLMLVQSRAAVTMLSLYEVYPVEMQLLHALETCGGAITHLVIRTSGLRHIPTSSSPHERAISDYLLMHIATPFLCPELQTLQLSPCMTSDGVLSAVAKARRLSSLAYSFVNTPSHLRDIHLLSTLEDCEVMHIL